MSTWYIDSNAVGGGTGVDWTNAYTTIIACTDAKAATGPHTYLVADNHVEGASWGAAETLDFGVAGRSTLTSVETTGDTYSKGAKLDNSTTQYLTVKGDCHIKGVLVENQRGINMVSTTSILNILFEDGKLGTLRNSSSDHLVFGGSSNNGYNRVDIIDTEIACGNAAQYHSVSANAKVLISGCNYTGTTLTALHGGSTDGCNIDFENTDLNGCTNLGWAASDIDAQNQNVTYKRCIAGTNATVDTSVGINGNANIDIWSLKRGTTDSYHYFESVYKDCGKVQEDTTVVRTGGATYYGSNQFSAKFLPNANVVELTKPLKFMLKAPTIDLSGASGATLTAHILLQDSAGTPISLTDMNCILKAVHPDSTDTSLGVTVLSTTKDVLDTPADLSTETVTFTDTSGTTKQHTIAVTIPQNTATGMDEAILELWLELSIDLAATTEMFVCPDPTVT